MSNSDLDGKKWVGKLVAKFISVQIKHGQLFEQVAQQNKKVSGNLDIGCLAVERYTKLIG